MKLTYSGCILAASEWFWKVIPFLIITGCADPGQINQTFIKDIPREKLMDDIILTSSPPVSISLSDDITGAGHALAFDVMEQGRLLRKITHIHSTHPDDWGKSAGTAYSYSLDTGQSWSKPVSNYPIPYMVGHWQDQLRNGEIFTLGIRDLPTMEDVIKLHGKTPPASRYYYKISRDQGNTWNEGIAELESAPEYGVIARSLPRIFQEPDGTLFMPAYSWYEKGCQALLLKSLNNGKNWTVASRIASTETVREIGVSDRTRYFETNVARVADGTLLAVIRTGGSDGAVVSVRSSDNGITWSQPAVIRSEPSQNIVTGKLPGLCLLPNGILVLLTSHIRNHSRIYISPDGTGRQWSEGFAVTSQTTGNVSMIGIDYDKVLVITSGYPVEYPGHDGRGTRSGEGELNWVSSREVSITRKSINKIDLYSKFSDGSIIIRTNLNASSNLNPATGIRGALDGSIHYSNSSMSDNNQKSGYYTIELDRSYKIAAISVALKTGEPEDARIYITNNRNNWGNPVAILKNAVHNTTEHILINPGIKARYIKVELDTEKGPVALTELGLYTAAEYTSNPPPPPAAVEAISSGHGIVELSWEKNINSKDIECFLITPELISSPDSAMDNYGYIPVKVPGNLSKLSLGKIASRGALYKFTISAVDKSGQSSVPVASKEVIIRN